MNHYRLLEHTADIGIEAEAESFAQLLEQAAFGLRAVITEATDIQPRQEVVLELGAADREELLVAWLGELLYLFESRHLLPAAFAIEQAEATRLRARVRGEPLDPRRHPVEREVKAVTYHRILVEEAQGSWRARVYLDL
ncbi:protein archease [Desulfuromonas versatilis]|uniref:Protein archease n=1 Tax=Desulfuromonas versatilis TaxID=2802975 RepID=A0ABM8HVE8_9BACT|nr:protein archease [Desulfuromonas versatilis]